MVAGDGEAKKQVVTERHGGNSEQKEAVKECQGRREAGR